MEKYSKSAIILLAALSLAGCSKTEEFQTNSDSALQIESVSGISPFVPMREPESKAVITGETLPAEEASKGIGLFVTATDGGDYDGKTTGYSNVKYTCNSDNWSTQAPIYLSNTTGKLYGYFPYSETAANLKAVPVASSLNGTDYLYATSQDVSFSNKSVNLQMNHALARLHLTIKKGDKYLIDCNLSKIILQSKAIDASGTMDITTGTVSATKAADATGTFELTGTDAVTAAGITKDILLVPANSVEGKKDLILTLTIDGVEAEVKFTADKGLDIRSGIQYNATLTIEDTGIKVTGVGVGVWGDGGSQTVQVDGHTVTVKLSDDAGIADDLIVQVTSNESSVIVKTYSDSGKPLVVRNDDATLIAPVEDGNKSTFTISDITTNVTATLAYAKTKTVTFNKYVDKAPNVEGYVYGTAESIEVLEGRPATLTATPGEGYDIDYFVVKGTRYGDKAEVVIPGDVEKIDVFFRFADWLSGVFSVGENKKVRFSRGNLWCDGTGDGYTDLEPKIKSWGFEMNQYETTPSEDGDRTIGHLSHYVCCNSAEVSIRQRYEDGTASNILFTNADATTPNSNFAVNGQKGFWRVLSGGAEGEWDYLLNRRDGNRFAKATVHGMNGLLIFPDGYSLPSGYSSAGGTGMTKVNASADEYYPSSSEIPAETWSEMEANGVVFLPAAGFCYDQKGGTFSISYDLSYVGDVGYQGIYWSSSMSPVGLTYCLLFDSYNVNPFDEVLIFYASAVRLVTDVN